MANQHFFKPLLPDFHTHLTIPASFLKNIDGKTEKKTVKLRSDASKLSWEVKIDGQRITDGWKEFALAHDLRVGDIVIFRQENDLASFHLTIFGPSCCDIQYANKNPEREAESSSSLDASCFVATLPPSSLRYNRLNLPMSFVRANGIDVTSGEILLKNEKGRSWTLALRQKKSCKVVFISRGWTSFCLTNGLKAGDIFTFKFIREAGTLVLRLMPKESEEENNLDEKISHDCSIRKEKSRLRWKASSSPYRNRFVTLILRPYNVQKGVMFLPAPFTKFNGINAETKMTLMDKYGGKWSTNLRIENARIKMVGGWKDCFEASNVMIGESIILKLIWEQDTSCVLKFHSKVKPKTK